MNLANALYDQLRRGLFQHDAGTPQLHGLNEFILVFRRGQNYHAGALVGLLERLQSTEPIQVGHAKIEQEYVGVQLLDLVQHLAAVGGFSHHLNVLLQTEELVQAIPYDGVIVGNQYADHSLSGLQEIWTCFLIFDCRKTFGHV